MMLVSGLSERTTQLCPRYRRESIAPPLTGSEDLRKRDRHEWSRAMVAENYPDISVNSRSRPISCKQVLVAARSWPEAACTAVSGLPL